MPRMAIMPEDIDSRTGNIVDIPSRSGMIVERREVFPMPTIQVGRLQNFALDDRLPQIRNAFTIPAQFMN
jgi:hypothetical protein